MSEHQGKQPWDGPFWWGMDVACGPDKSAWHCSECGDSDKPCKHAEAALERGEPVSNSPDAKSSPVPDTEVCRACRHGVSWHFNDVTGVARCLVVHRGESTSGIIGIPYERRCPCANFQMPTPPPSSEEPKISEGLRQIMREALRKARGST